MAKRSDASMSKFSQKLDGEDKMTKGMGKKRKVIFFDRFKLTFVINLLIIGFFFIKFESNFRETGSEKSSQLKILDSITSNRDKGSKERINAEKAANKYISEENVKS